MTLTDFLLARIAEDEQDARSIHEADCDLIAQGKIDPRFGWECDCGWPARVLAECEAKRRIVQWHKPLPGLGGYSPNCEGCWEDGGEDGAPLCPCRNVRWLAEVYADHPDYRSEWRP